jgi:hypothetical protein
MIGKFRRLDIPVRPGLQKDVELKFYEASSYWT